MKLLPYTLIGYCIYGLLALCFYSPLHAQNLRPRLVRPLNRTNDFATDARELCDTLIGVVAGAEGAGIGAAASSLLHAQVVHSGRKRNSIKRETV